jgi:hypothetical protein
LINLGGVNRILPERRAGRPAAYVDIDPGYTQIRVVDGHLRDLLAEHRYLFTFGENIGTPRSPLPTGGYVWNPTRQPVVLDLWGAVVPAGQAYTTVGTWDARGRDLTFRGETFRWRKRTEWMRFLDLPGRTGASFSMAMDVDSVPGDAALLARHGWDVRSPLEVSTDPWVYREFVQRSRGEFSVAKDVNVRLRSGWFSDRAACYLAAGRPVVEQDTGFGDVLPLGPGVHAFASIDQAAAAIAAIEDDYPSACAHARAVAQEHLAAETVLSRMLARCGL